MALINSDVPAVSGFIAQLAAGSGDASNIEFHGDAGHVRYRDLVTTSNTDYNPNTPSRVPSKLRKTIANGSVAATSGLCIDVEAGPAVDAAAAGISNNSAVASPRSLEAQLGVQLRTSVLDALSLLQTLDEDSALRMKAVSRRAADANAAALLQVFNFEKQFRYTSRVGFTVERLIRECNLENKVPFLQSFGLPIVVPAVEDCLAAVSSLDAHLIPAAEADATRARIRTSITRPLFPFGDQKLPDLLLAMNSFAFTDVLGTTRRQLASTVGPLADLSALIARERGEFSALRDSEQLEAAEDKVSSIIQLLSQQVDIHEGNMKLLSSGDVRSGGLLAQLDALMNSPAVVELTTSKEKLKEAAERDMRTMDSDRTARLQNNEESIATYNDRMRASRAALEANVAQQQEQWRQLMETLGALHRLTEDNRNLMEHHMEVTEVEHKRRKDFSEYKDVYASHRHTLEELARSCETALVFLDEVSTYFARGRDKIVGMRIEENVLALLEVERKAYAAAYTQYGETCGSSLERCCTRAVGLQHMTNLVQFQRRAATSVDDTDIQDYRHTLAELEASAKALQRKYERRSVEYAKREGSFLDFYLASFPAQGSTAAIVATGGDGGDNAEAEGIDSNPVIKLHEQFAHARSKFVREVEGLTASDVAATKDAKERVRVATQLIEERRSNRTLALMPPLPPQGSA